MGNVLTNVFILLIFVPVSAGLILNFTFVKMKEPNKLTSIQKYNII